MKLQIPIGSGPNITAQAVVLDENKCRETAHLDSDLEGKIAICTAPVGREFLHKCLFLGLAGVVVPGVHYKDWVSINPDEGMPVLVLKQFGFVELADPEKKDLHALNGKQIALNRSSGHSYELSTTS